MAPEVPVARAGIHSRGGGRKQQEVVEIRRGKREEERERAS